MWVGLSIAQSDVDFWVDDFGLFEGGPSDKIEQLLLTVKSVGKLPVFWADIKKGY